jgi:hypothetical protein
VKSNIAFITFLFPHALACFMASIHEMPDDELQNWLEMQLHCVSKPIFYTSRWGMTEADAIVSYLARQEEDSHPKLENAINKIYKKWSQEPEARIRELSGLMRIVNELALEPPKDIIKDLEAGVYKSMNYPEYGDLHLAAIGAAFCRTEHLNDASSKLLKRDSSDPRYGPACLSLRIDCSSKADLVEILRDTVQLSEEHPESIAFESFLLRICEKAGYI